MNFLGKLNVYLTLMNYPYNDYWDRKVNSIIDNDEVVELCRFYATLKDGKCLWIENYPFSYGTPYGYERYRPCMRPSRSTIIKLRNYITSKEEELL